MTGEESSEMLVKKLQKSKLIVDESTDLSCIKLLCMFVRTLIGDKVTDCFLGLIPLQDATARALYDAVTMFLLITTFLTKKI